jgi:hypothetical protein
VTDQLAPMPELCRRAGGEGGPEDALRAVAALRERLAELERDHVVTMLGEGASWAQIAAALGISRQAAHRRFGKLPRPAPPGPASTEVKRILVTGYARATIQMARQEAKELGAEAVGTEHLLLALTRNAPEPMARALEQAGIDERALRASLQPTLVREGPPRAARMFTSHARDVLEGSLREALERSEGYIGPDHLLLALLRNPAGGAARTLEELGVDTQAVFGEVAAG